MNLRVEPRNLTRLMYWMYSWNALWFWWIFLIPDNNELNNINCYLPDICLEEQSIMKGNIQTALNKVSANILHSHHCDGSNSDSNFNGAGDEITSGLRVWTWIIALI